MTDKLPGHWDRYDVSGNIEAEYVDDAKTVLVNKQGITDLLTAQTGRPLLVYDESEHGKARYICAASVAFRKEYRPMEEIIRQALLAGRKKEPPTAR